MTSVVPDILARIVAHKRRELAAARIPLAELEKRGMSSARRNFHAALAAGPPAVIAEIKRASPSKGLLTADFDPPAIARAYAAGGAAALSVLTDREFFKGSLDDLASARAAVPVPVLRKDFTVDPYHVAEAAAWGADAILLIVAALTDRELWEYREYAESFGMAALVEVHDAAELERAAASGARIVGVNNRDLRTFDVRLETSLSLADRIPDGVTRVSESGIQTREDVALLRRAGYHAFLVGEHLMTSADAAAAITELRR
jgi:indole-3-glycerol phosphate synthase